MNMTIKGELTDLNTYVNAERTNKYKGAKIKKNETYRCMAAFLPYRMREIELPIDLKIKWFCKNRKKDPDNISFGQKFILDGMQKAGVIPNDGFAQINSIHHDYEIDKNNPRIEIEI